ncbi:MAG: glycosyltransferase family 4 protein [Bacteroidia bacterium]|nr:glycosyltransferase family 4 protein [Bacteroidia bacterium]
MIIGFDAKRIFYNKTGLGNYARSLVAGLNQLAPQHSYHLFTPGNRIYADFLENETNVTRHFPESLMHKKLPSLWRSKGISQDIKKAGVQIYHGLSNELPSTLVQPEIKKVVSIHDLIFLRFPHLYPWLDRKIYERKFRQAIQNADLVLATSEHTKKDILHFYDCDASKIEVLYQSCDAQFSQRITDEQKYLMKRKYGLQREYILSVGTLEQRKNHLNLLKAFVKSDLHDVDILLLGKKADAYPALIKFVQEHNLNDRVKFIHDAPFADFPALYQASLGMVYISYYEGFGIPILEAMHSQIPVLCATVSSLPEVAGKAAIYVKSDQISEIADGLNQLVYNQQKRTELLGLAQTELPKFYMPTICSQLLRSYSALLS